MDVTMLQSSRVMIPWRPLSATSKWDSFDSCRSPLRDPFGGTFQAWMTRPASGGNIRVGFQSLQLSRNARQCGNHKTLRQLTSPIMSGVQAGSEKVPATEELKTQLEDLQLEASQVRDRYNSSRARFMRLAQVAEQLQQRALVDLKLGKENNARQLLMEKKKVMRAAELSKRRSELYEELATKLSEAISRKETQLIVALSSSPPKVTVSEEPKVRVVYPTDNGSALVKEGLEEGLGERSSDPGIGQAFGSSDLEDRDESPQLSERDPDTDSITEIRPDENLFDPKPTTDTELVEAPRDESACEESDSSRTTWAGNDRGEQSVEEINIGDKDYSYSAISTEDSEQIFEFEKEEPETSNEESYLEDKVLEEPYSRDGNEGAPGTMDTGMESLSLHKEEAGRKMGLKEHEESLIDKEEKVLTKVDESLVLKEYLRDIDSHVAGVESKLQDFLLTADILLGSESDMKDERVVLVKHLLEQVQCLRARIVEAVFTSSNEQSQ